MSRMVQKGQEILKWDPQEFCLQIWTLRVWEYALNYSHKTEARKIIKWEIKSNLMSEASL